MPAEAMENNPLKDVELKASPGAPLRAAQLLLLVNALLWIGLGIYSLFRFPLGDLYVIVAWVVVGLMFINALLLLWVAWGLGRGSHTLYWLGLAQVGVNLILAVTDQVGIWDLIVLLLSAITLALLFTQRRHFGVKW
jgi:hypothetical protein